MVICINDDTIYALVEFREALPPQELRFLVVVAGKAGNNHQKTIILGGLAALQTSLRDDRVIPVKESK